MIRHTQSVYGDSRLHDWAWKHIEGTGNDITGEINVDTAVNGTSPAMGLETYLNRHFPKLTTIWNHSRHLRVPLHLPLAPPEQWVAN